MSTAPVRGRFITLEGGEGVGKSTQARALATALRDRGLDVVETREPGGSPGAEAIRGLLLTGDEDRWGAEAEALLFAAARADHVAKTIRPALERGAWVVCDRFVDSSRAYQGGADGIGDAAVMALHAIGSGGLLPDRTLLLLMPMLDAMQRALGRDGNFVDRFGERSFEYHHSVEHTFRGIAAEDSRRCRSIDASGDAADVTGRLLDALAGLLP